MKPVFIVSTLGALLLALICRSEWLSTFFIIGGILAFTLGLAVMVTAVVSLVTRSHSSTVYTKPTSELRALHKYLTVSTHSFCDEWRDTLQLSRQICRLLLYTTSWCWCFINLCLVYCLLNDEYLTIYDCKQ